MLTQEVLQRVLGEFEKAVDKSVDLFAALKMDELTDRWSIYLAANWIAEINRQSSFTTLVNILLKDLSKEDVASIARVGVFNSSEYLAHLMLEKYTAPHYIKEDDQINGNVIHEGYIVASNPALKKI